MAPQSQLPPSCLTQLPALAGKIPARASPRRAAHIHSSPACLIHGGKVKSKDRTSNLLSKSSRQDYCNRRAEWGHFSGIWTFAFCFSWKRESPAVTAGLNACSSQQLTPITFLRLGSHKSEDHQCSHQTAAQHHIHFLFT